MAKFPLYMQPKDSDVCGPTCLKMIASYYGIEVDLDSLIKQTNTIQLGASMLALSEAAEKIGFKPIGIKIKSSELSNNSFYPCIAHINLFHFVVIYKVKNDLVYIADPSRGFQKKTKKHFEKTWLHETERMGKLLLINL